MGTYAQWDKSRNLARLVWVYGPEDALVQDVREYVKGTVSAKLMDTFSFDAATDKESDIWDTIYSRSLVDGLPRMIEVVNSHKLKDLEKLVDWIKIYSKYSPETTVLLVADEECPHSSVKSPKATVVRCTMAKIEDKLKWTVRQGKLSDSTAKRLLEYKNGNLTETANICRKVRTLLPDMDNIELSLETIQSIDEETPCVFVDAVLEGDKQSALNAVRTIPSDGLGKVLATLDYTLTLIDRLRDIFAVLPRGQKLEPIPHFPMARLAELSPLAHKMSFSDIVKCRQILTVVESYQRQGVSEGLLEALVTML